MNDVILAINNEAKPSSTHPISCRPPKVHHNSSPKVTNALNIGRTSKLGLCILPFLPSSPVLRELIYTRAFFTT